MLKGVLYEGGVRVSPLLISEAIKRFRLEQGRGCQNRSRRNQALLPEPFFRHWSLIPEILSHQAVVSNGRGARTSAESVSRSVVRLVFSLVCFVSCHVSGESWED